MSIIDRRLLLSTLTLKFPVRVATTANLDELRGLLTIDGVTVAALDRVLVKDQDDGTENGIYTAASGAWDRAQDFNDNSDFAQFTRIYVGAGSSQAGFEFQLTTSTPSLGTSDLTFERALDSDLISIVDLTPTDDDILQRKAGAWTNRSMAQLAVDLDPFFLTMADGDVLYQPLDTDLTAIAALTRTRGDIIRGGASAWERLALGTSGYHIQSDGTDAAWAGFLQAGTGAQTRTWQSKAREFIHVADFGAVGDGTTNDTAAIQAAIDHVESLGGGEVHLDAKVYSSTDLTIDASAVRLVGVATGRMFSGSASQFGTRIRARSGTTTLLTTTSPAAASSAIGGGGVEDLVLDGNAIATRSLFVKSLTNFTYRNLMLLGATTAQLETGIVSEAFAGLNTVCSCAFENIWVHCSSGAASAKGIVLGGDPGDPGGNRTIFCSFKHVHITHKDGTALEINDADNNSFYNVGISREVAGSAVGIHLIGTDADAQDLVHCNLFFYAHAGAGGWLSDGDQAINNVVFGLGTEDGVPITISNGGELWHIKDDGDFLLGHGRFINSTDNASVQVLSLEGDRATPADNDSAHISLKLSDDAGTQTEFARISWVASDVNAGTSVDGRLDFAVTSAGVLAGEMSLIGTALLPSTSDGLALGLSTNMWSDLFLASGGVIDWNGDVTLTHGTDLLALNGASNFVIGHTAAVNSSGTGAPRLQVHGTDEATTGSANVRWSATTTGGNNYFLKSRGVTPGSHVIVQSGDALGQFRFGGSDGTNFIDAVVFGGRVDSTPGTNDMPGHFFISTTPDGSATPTERYRVDSKGFSMFTGSIGRGLPVTKTGDFTLADTENYVINNRAASNTATLPAASAWPGREVFMKTIQAQTVVSASSNVVPSTSATAGTAILPATDGAWALLVSDGTNWIIMAANPLV